MDQSTSNESTLKGLNICDTQIEDSNAHHGSHSGFLWMRSWYAVGMTLSGSSPDIGSLNEKSLHASLKTWYAGPNDLFEVPVDGFVVDIVQDDYMVEIQTRNLGAMKRKLSRLLPDYRMRLVHPIAREKWIVKMPTKRGGKTTRRKSPARGTVENIFDELVSIPNFVAHPNFSMVVLLIQEEEVRRHDPKRAWRRKGWVTEERKLIDVVEQHLFQSPEDWLKFVPAALPDPFTTEDLAEATGHPQSLAQKTTYCLREMGVIEQVGTKNRFKLYSRSPG